ncbi:S-layer homology domain-containing protein [Paenibacillus sp. MMS20-IR301]|uniref:S-layer homology domain-containing protein n=1 Tax=Paenibacillus sp. MMS20-IR301 TaxID=2895946 RepID=UPI0028E6C63B|nr:S-layer homology domain-containing protein [Paenibacillus sp. MMS20-IR301]WNS42647.1 S-layer homology domain-containing protein [Paenibacillus sp. MMS20-IR301]
MLRFKRPFVWLLLAALIVSMFPGKYMPQAAAATTTYFSPDENKLRDTVTLDPNVVPATPTPAGLISRDSVFLTTNQTLSITGTYSQVTSSTMKVTVEQLTQGTNGKWTTDSTRLTTGTVTPDANNPSNRFTTSGVVLYAGFNKVTFSGLQGNLTRSESFYVLYDKVPYISSLKVLGGPTALNLNEGTQVVVPVDTVTLQGTVSNATQVTMSVNGGTILTTTLLEDGTFFSPSLTLKPGFSTIKLNIKNASDAIDIERSLYFFDNDQPYASLSLVHNAGTYNILNNIPTLSDNTTNKAGFSGEVLVPYNANSFASSGKLTINKGATGAVPVTGINVSSELVIPGADGVTPAYRLVKFNTNADLTLITGLNEFTLAIDYGTYSSSLVYSYRYLPGEIVITDMYYLSDYSGSGSIAGISKLPLNGQQMEKDNFYIMVKTNVPIGTSKLSANYLPLSNKSLALSDPPITGMTGQGATEYIYRITGFSNGQQNVQFRYGTSDSYYNAQISYVSKNYIYVSNLQDGQTYEFSSSTDTKLNVAGEYIGFENFVSAQVQINGIDSNSLPDTKDVQGVNRSNKFALGVDQSKKTFSFDLWITQSGPLVYGENKIVFTGISQDNGQNQRVITKELKIYIIDTNVSNLSQFHPALGTGRTAFSMQSLSNEAERNKILTLPAEFVYKDEKYTTNSTSYDLVLRGGGATILNLYRGSELIFTSAGLTDMLATNDKLIGPLPYGPTGQYFDYFGSSNDFLLRLRDFKFDAPGSHVYTIELINKTGARTTQRLEVTREVSPYRVLSPVATVGNQIVVNKNFVRFDIEAEGATKVMIDKYEAVKRNDLDNRFTYDFVGLKPDKATAIKIQIVRADSTLNDTISVYYASAIQIDTQFMAEKVATKYSVFNKALQLTFPKGTIMKGYTTTGAAKYYPDTKLLFGIADPVDGVVERTNDYGNIINVSPTDSRTLGGKLPLVIPQELVLRFTSTANTNNFTRVSDIYWLNGGLGETGTQGSQSYIAATNGIAPYSIEGYFTQYSQTRKIVPSQRGELTLSFNSSIVDEVGSTVTVFRYTDAGKWENIGGEVDTKSHTVTVPFDEFGYYTVMKLRRGFTDITNHPWARNLLNGLYSKGIMTNIRSDAFGADDTTTRGEFATLLVTGLSIPLNYDNNKQTFFDIVPEAVSTTWNFKSIETAARAGIITGLSDGFFGPDQSLTREQAAVMIARALKLKMSANDAKLLTSLGKSFVDSGSMDFYSRPAIEAVSKAKIMEGSAATITGQTKPVYNFNPKGKLTRAEAGKIVVALLQKSTSIFPKNFN